MEVPVDSSERRAFILITMEKDTQKFLILALLAVMLEQENGIKPNNPEYIKLWEQFEEDAKAFSLNAL